MEATYFALEMLLPVAVMLAALRLGGERPTVARIGWGLALAVGVWVLLLWLAVTGGITSAIPGRAALLSACCAGVMVAGVSRTAWVRWGGVALVLALLVLLIAQYNRLLWTGRYTQSPAALQNNLAQRRERQLRTIASTLRLRAATDTRTYPAGWLSESPLVGALDDTWRQANLTATDRHAATAWHASITQLYPTTSIPVRVWYPGGKAKEGLPGMEFRTADGQPCLRAGVPAGLLPQDVRESPEIRELYRSHLESLRERLRKELARPAGR